jgi:hypothetical protein
MNFEILYALTPINENDVYFKSEMIKKIKRSAEQAKNRKVKRITSSEKPKIRKDFY